MTSDLTAFLAARLDEVAAAAKAASRDKPNGDAWHAGDGGDGWTQPGTPVLGPDEHLTAFAIGDYAARHIALHDPKRELREVEAGRSLLANYEEIRQFDPGDSPEERAQRMAIAEVVLMLIIDRARVWSDHPDFRAEWKL